MLIASLTGIAVLQNRYQVWSVKYEDLILVKNYPKYEVWGMRQINLIKHDLKKSRKPFSWLIMLYLIYNNNNEMFLKNALIQSQSTSPYIILTRIVDFFFEISFDYKTSKLVRCDQFILLQTFQYDITSEISNLAPL